MTTHATLVAARALIATTERWGKGPLTKLEHEGKLCMTMACGKAIGTYEGYQAAIDALRKATGDPRLAEWNDAPGRTHADIIAAFSAAIEATKEGV